MWKKGSDLGIWGSKIFIQDASTALSALSAPDSETLAHPSRIIEGLGEFIAKFPSPFSHLMSYHHRPPKLIYAATAQHATAKMTV